MKYDKINTGQSAFLFNVDLLVRGESNALAMENLLHLLNQGSFADYRIKSGIELGRLIEELEAKQPVTVTPNKEPLKIEPVKNTAADSAAELTFVTDRIKASIADNRLIRLVINKGFGIKLNIPCRVINFDPATQMLTVYHVDEKQVYSFTLNEIDDFVI